MILKSEKLVILKYSHTSYIFICPKVVNLELEKSYYDQLESIQISFQDYLFKKYSSLFKEPSIEDVEIFDMEA